MDFTPAPVDAEAVAALLRTELVADPVFELELEPDLLVVEPCTTAA